MPARIFFLLLCAIVLSSCADDMDTSSSPQKKQIAHTNPVTGQTTYTYQSAESQ